MNERRLKEINPKFAGITGRALMEKVELRLGPAQIDVGPDGRSATLKAAGTYEYVWKANRGAGLPPVSSAQLEWRLQNRGAGWAVVSSN